MDRYTVLPSGRYVESFLYLLTRNAYKKCRSIVNALVKGYKVSYKEDAEGLAYMNHNTKTIVVNPLVYLSQVDPLYDDLNKKFPDKGYTMFDNICNWGFIGVICHEIGHALYTLSPEESKQYASVSKVPEYFLHFCSNVVEDSYIQNKMKERFKWDLMRDGINTSTTLFQGNTTCEEFSKKDKYTPQDKLFYFILRSYNHGFLPPDGCVIPNELVEEFLTFYYANDAVLRFKCTLSWAEKVYEWLKDELKDEDQDQQNQGNSSDDSSDSSSGNGSGSGSGSCSSKSGNKSDIEQAIKDLVESLSKKTGVGYGSDKTEGSFDKSNMANSNTISDIVSLCNGILKKQSKESRPLNETARKLLTNYNLNFKRLQVYSFNGTLYNQTSGSLNKKRLYKSDYTPKIFTKDIGRKREMDLYFGITLDSSGSMRGTYDILVDIIVPLIHSLNEIKAKSEMLVFADDTIKVKDYYDSNIKTLYQTAIDSNSGGCTDLLPSLQYFSSIIRERNHRDKCIIVVTDGETSNHEECAEYVRSLNKLNATVIGIGLKLGKNPTWFKDLFQDNALLYDSEDSIKENIAKDLISYLSNKFMKR